MTPQLHPRPTRFLTAGLSITLAAALALWGCTGDHSLESLGPDGEAEIDSVLAVNILPPSATLETGQLAKFSAREFRLAGDTVAAAVEWSASGGSITPLGLFSSELPGKFTIIGWRWNRRGQRQSDSLDRRCGATGAESHETHYHAGTALTGCRSHRLIHRRGKAQRFVHHTSRRRVAGLRRQD